MDKDKSSHVPIILERPFLATIRVVIDVPTRKIPCQLCGERVYFYFPPSIALLVLVPLVFAGPMVPIVHTIVCRTDALDGDRWAIPHKDCSLFLSSSTSLD